MQSPLTVMWASRVREMVERRMRQLAQQMIADRLLRLPARSAAEVATRFRVDRWETVARRYPRPKASRLVTTQLTFRVLLKEVWGDAATLSPIALLMRATEVVRWLRLAAQITDFNPWW